MQRRYLLSAMLLLVTASCGGSMAGDTTTSGAGGGTTGATTGSTATSGTTGSVTSGTTSSSSSGTGGSAGSTVTIKMDSFTVDPGAEVYWCQNFSNPFGGADVEVQEFESHMSAGSHHLLLFYKDVTDGALQSCSGLEFAPTPYGSQSPDDSLTFPTGVAALIPGTTGIRLQSHYLNTTTSPITAHVEVSFHIAAPGTVQNQAGVLFVVDTDIHVPPGPASTATVSDDCTIPQDMNVIRAQSHMHRHATGFVSTVAGNTVFQTDTWSDPPPVRFTPPTVFHAGDPLHFACSYLNNDATTLTFGESAQTNEMCIFTAFFYPTPAGKATTDADNCKTSQK